MKPHTSLSFRRNGWTPQRQLAFLDTLARTHSVTKAARAASMSRESAYRLRKREPDGLFAAAWDRALKTPVPSEPKGHKRVIRNPRPKRRQRPGLGWNSIKGHKVHDPLFSSVLPSLL